MKIFKNKPQFVLTVIYIGFVIWWASFQHIVKKQGLSVQWFEGVYGVVALIGAIIGFNAARKWGGFKTVVGKALTYFAIGLLAQELGQLITSYYIYGAKIQTPYPSWDDVAYFGSVIFYILGAVTLTKLTGAKFSLKSGKYKAMAFVLPAVLLAISYVIFLRDYQYSSKTVLTMFFDYGYPFGEALYVSFALTAYLLSRKILGGIIKPTILLLIVALLVQYASDFTFLYQADHGTWLAGEYDDLLYLTAYFLLSSVMIQFINIYKSLRQSSPTADAPAIPRSTESI